MMLDMFWSQDVILSSKWYWISFYTEDESKSANWLHLWCISTRVTSMMYKSSRLWIKLEVSQAQIWDTIRLAYILWYKRRFEQARHPELRYENDVITRVHLRCMMKKSILRSKLDVSSKDTKVEHVIMYQNSHSEL